MFALLVSLEFFNYFLKKIKLTTYVFALTHFVVVFQGFETYFSDEFTFTFVN
jgi:hypothetical protein